MMNITFIEYIRNYANNYNGMGFKTMAVYFAAGAMTALLVSRKMGHKSCGWAGKMREDVKRRIMETKDMTQEKYNQIIKDKILPFNDCEVAKQILKGARVQ